MKKNCDSEWHLKNIMDKLVSQWYLLDNQYIIFQFSFCNKQAKKQTAVLEIAFRSQIS
jgi:hypothetical protein